jgi:hypothetical protein
MISASEFDKKFDDGEEDIVQYLDLSSTTRPGRQQQRVNVDLPIWMVKSLDREAQRIGVTRQSIIKVWLAERLERLAPSHADLRASLGRVQVGSETLVREDRNGEAERD